MRWPSPARRRGRRASGGAQSELAAILTLLCSLPTPPASGEQANGGLVLHPPGEQVGAATLNSSRSGRPGGRTAPGRSLAEAARAFFQTRLSERITIATVARHLLMSPSAFSHSYAREAGQSPMAALADLRMELARNLLLRGLKMDAIARQTGFCDAFHFSKAFRKAVRHAAQRVPPRLLATHADLIAWRSRASPIRSGVNTGTAAPPP